MQRVVGKLARLVVAVVTLIMALVACTGGGGSTTETNSRGPQSGVADPVPVAGTPSAVAYGQNIHTFVRGVNLGLFDDFWDGSQWTWYNLGLPDGETVGSNPESILVNAGGQLEVYCFVISTSGKLLANYGPPSSVQRTWVNLGGLGGPRAVGVPQAIVFKPSNSTAPYLYVFIIGSDGHLYSFSSADAVLRLPNVIISDLGKPSNANLEGNFGVGAYLVGNPRTPRLYAFTEGVNGHLYEYFWDRVNLPYGDLSTATIQDFGTPPNTTVSGNPSVIDYGTNFYVFVHGANERLYVDYWDGSQWIWADQGQPAGVGGAGFYPNPATATYGLGDPYCPVGSPGGPRLYAFLSGVNGHVYQDYWNGTQWSFDDFGTPPSGLAASHPATLVTQTNCSAPRFYVFVTTQAHTLAMDLWTPSSRANVFNGAWVWSDLGIA
jgi:hypothetical protein